MAQLDLHLPDQEEFTRDVQSKLVIVKTTTRNVDEKHNTQFVRVDRHFQCQCGIYHDEGRHASKNRQIGWENVGCPFWVKLVTVRRRDDRGKFRSLLAVMYCAPILYSQAG
jgi:hypothetical protein